MQYSSVTCCGHDLAYAEAGSGPPLLLLPGHTSSAERWEALGYVPALAEEWHVIAVDPLGHGRSSKTAEIDAYAPERLVDHTLAVMDDLGIGSTTVWGYSRGAAIGGLVARQHPERVSALVYGGNTLFDHVKVLIDLGLRPSDETIDAGHRRAVDGDWTGYWDTFPVPLPDDVKRSLESQNDLASISASAVAGHRNPVVWSPPPEAVPTLAYWGTDEIFDELNRQVAGEQDLTISRVSGGHAEAFIDAEAALGIVLPSFADSAEVSDSLRSNTPRPPTGGDPGMPVGCPTYRSPTSQRPPAPALPSVR
jgi:pimeloyl-ACP methyl ester carboxylesterase